MRRRFLAAGYLAFAISGVEVGSATAQDVVKIGVVIPMTGAFAAVGREVAAGAKLYIQRHGDRPISIDPRTRDIVQNVYIRKVEKVNGEPWAIEFATFEAVKDPLKEAAAQ
jgi:hypothetical protein